MPDTWHLLVLGLCGAAGGFIDAIAGGGGMLTVPALLWAGLPPVTALGTNKMQSACGTSLAVWTYARGGLIRWRTLWPAIPVVFAAAAAGAWTATGTSPDLLRAIIPWMLLALAAWTAFSPRLGEVERAARLPVLPFLFLTGSILGFYDGFFGPGTGSFWTLACVALAGWEIRRATAATKVMNLTSNIASLTIFLAAGQVNAGVAGVMIAGQLVGARLGARLVLRDGARIVRPVLIATVLVLAGKLLWENYG